MSIRLFKGTFVPDDHNSDHGKEALLDFEISWVFRICANPDEQRLRPNLYHQCSIILDKLLSGSISGDTPKINVNKTHGLKVLRQWKSLDILVELSINDSLHVFAIEDKAYTQMGQEQRDGYPQAVLDYYSDKNDVSFHFCVITLFDPNYDWAAYSKLVHFCQEKKFGPNGEYTWHVFSTSDLPDWDVDNYTESDIFNEFWFAQW